jgi:hypothetical protein
MVSTPRPAASGAAASRIVEEIEVGVAAQRARRAHGAGDDDRSVGLDRQMQEVCRLL